MVSTLVYGIFCAVASFVAVGLILGWFRRPRPEMPIEEAARLLGREIVGIREHVWGVGIYSSRRRFTIPFIYPPVAPHCFD